MPLDEHILCFFFCIVHTTKGHERLEHPRVYRDELSNYSRQTVLTVDDYYAAIQQLRLKRSDARRDT